MQQKLLIIVKATVKEIVYKVQPNTIKTYDYDCEAVRGTWAPWCFELNAKTSKLINYSHNDNYSMLMLSRC